MPRITQHGLEEAEWLGWLLKPQWLSFWDGVRDIYVSLIKTLNLAPVRQDTKPWPVWENSFLIGFVWWYSVPVPAQPSSPHTPSAHHCQQARKISLTSSTLHKHSFFYWSFKWDTQGKVVFCIQDEARWVNMVGKTTTANLGMHPNLSYANFVRITAWPWKDRIKFLSNLKGAWGWMTGLVKYAMRCPSSGWDQGENANSLDVLVEVMSYSIYQPTSRQWTNIITVIVKTSYML